MKKIQGFDGMTDRYSFDFGCCSVAKGFAQVDTSQDASYFGIWANPFERIIFTYAEGDMTLEEAESDEEFVQAIRDLKRWHDESGHRFKGIDPGLETGHGSLEERFRALGLGDLLH